MNLNEQLESRIQLLNNYALCLERENESKSKQISTLHNHLQVCTRENDSLRTIIGELRFKLNQKELQATISESLLIREPMEEGVFQLAQFDAECQTDLGDMETSAALKRQIDSLKESIEQKDISIENFQAQCEEMYEGIQKLEKCLAEHQIQSQKDKETIKKCEDRLRIEEKKRTAAEKRLEEVNMTIETVDSENQAVREHIFNLQNENYDLITENNKLIERTRELEKERTDYYLELKKFSRVSFGTDLGNSSFKRGPSKVKDQRWREIQSNLLKLQQQNEAIQSNLLINR